MPPKTGSLSKTTVLLDVQQAECKKYPNRVIGSTLVRKAVRVDVVGLIDRLTGSALNAVSPCGSGASSVCRQAYLLIFC